MWAAWLFGEQYARSRNVVDRFRFVCSPSLVRIAIHRRSGASNLERKQESKRRHELDDHQKEPRLIALLRNAGENHFELLVSLPQHSGRTGNEERSHPPPRA